MARTPPARPRPRPRTRSRPRTRPRPRTRRRRRRRARPTASVSPRSRRHQLIPRPQTRSDRPRVGDIPLEGGGGEGGGRGCPRPNPVPAVAAPPPPPLHPTLRPDARTSTASRRSRSSAIPHSPPAPSFADDELPRGLRRGMRGCARVGTARGIRGRNSVGTGGRALGRITATATPSLCSRARRTRSRGSPAKGARGYGVTAPAPRVPLPRSTTEGSTSSWTSPCRRARCGIDGREIGFAIVTTAETPEHILEWARHLRRHVSTPATRRARAVVSSRCVVVGEKCMASKSYEKRALSLHAHFIASSHNIAGIQSHMRSDGWKNIGVCFASPPIFDARGCACEPCAPSAARV